MKKDYRLQIQLDKEMAVWLKKRADYKRCSLAQVIRDLVLAAMRLK
jgi:hypothetical protein